MKFYSYKKRLVEVILTFESYSFYQDCYSHWSGQTLSCLTEIMANTCHRCISIISLRSPAHTLPASILISLTKCCTFNNIHLTKPQSTPWCLTIHVCCQTIPISSFHLSNSKLSEITQIIFVFHANLTFFLSFFCFPFWLQFIRHCWNKISLFMFTPILPIAWDRKPLRKSTAIPLNFLLFY